MTQMTNPVASAAALALAAVCFSPSPLRADVSEFYKGRTVNVLIGFSAGGGFDTYGRLLTRHLGRHIPGQPTVVAQNMPGAGSLNTANYLYRVAPKDGTVIGTFGRTVPITPLMTPSPFDGRAYTWIGSITSEVSTCVVTSRAKVQSWQEVLKDPLTVGGEGKDGDLDIMAQFVKNVFSAKTKLIAGYPGSNDVGLAMLRGEVDGMCGLSFSTARTRYKTEFDAGRLKVIVQATLQREEELPQVPSLAAMANEEQLDLMKVVFGSQMMARPFAGPPEMAQDRKSALRAAFKKTMEDPEFAADAKRANLEIKPAFGEEIDAYLAEIYAKPKSLIDKAKRAMWE